MGASGKPGMLRRAIERLTSSDEEIEAEELRTSCTRRGSQLIARCGDREQVTVDGALRTVTLRPRAGVPALEAELYDGSGTLHVVWLGRRRIPGIAPGRGMRATGRVSMDDGRPVMFNPIYELHPSAHA
ncbi:hypothetical protein CLV35_1327 [Motilibacter peucedani]|uniref:ATP-dependent DNA helicase RecG n=1 Tax=Motilibacter peucedani TaxID=598650 RepID=A0A420XRV9_9ACTN|nr:OB-fold nucleic acid binding domain-containing protein [Motilibacter peucedani]RKS77633.1 hypothetical protein CLV35_1327 [Motilibacter peucedani]